MTLSVFHAALKSAQEFQHDDDVLYQMYKVHYFLFLSRVQG